MKRINRISLLAVLVAGFFVFAHAMSFASEKHKYITTDELKSKMDAGLKALTLVNALSPVEFKELTIKGSINIPASKVKAGNPLLPKDLSSLLIFYCKGPKCGKSRVAADKAKKMGYTNIMVYNEGLPAWAKKRYPLVSEVKYPKVDIERMKPEAINAQLANLALLDIRGKKHLKLGKIKGAIHILLDDIEAKYSSLPKDKKIVIFDHAGKQVLICGKFLHMKGYTNLALMDGGVTAWLRAKLPVEK